MEGIMVSLRENLHNQLTGPVSLTKFLLIGGESCIFRNVYFWMIFKILIGIWLFISPFVFGYRDLMGASTNRMIFGAVITLLGVGVSIYEYYHKEVRVIPEMERQKA